MISLTCILIFSFRIVDNDEWYSNTNVIGFLSSVGKKFRMGAMLLKESVSIRMKSSQGMNLAEFSYQVFQANDWLHLYKTCDCRFQVRYIAYAVNFDLFSRITVNL